MDKKPKQSKNENQTTNKKAQHEGTVTGMTREMKGNKGNIKEI